MLVWSWAYSFLRPYPNFCRSIFLRILPAFFAIGCGVRCETFTVQGIAIVTDNILQFGVSNKTVVARSQFSVSVRGCEWILRIKPDNKEDYSECAFDGESMYYLDSFVNWRRSQLQAGGRVGHNSGFAILKKDSMPMMHPPESAIAWFAYASSCELKGISNRVVRPIFYEHPSLVEHDHRYTFLGDIERAEQSPRLPASAVFFYDGFYRQLPDSWRGEFLLKPRSAPFQNGFTNSIYTTFSWTNIGRSRFPVQVGFVHFEPKENATSSSAGTTQPEARRNAF